ncbi:MAG: hypothetical protein HPY76_01500 [Anaerolineae bacterium]|nr:hypothetical protein [Anaerolineae bacterium]
MSTSSDLLFVEHSKATFVKVIDVNESDICMDLPTLETESLELAESNSEDVGQKNLMFMVCLIGKMLTMRFPGLGSNCVNLQFEFLAPIQDGDQIETTIEVANLDPDKLIATCNIDCKNQDKNQVIIGTAAMLLRKHVLRFEEGKSLD